MTESRGCKTVTFNYYIFGYLDPVYIFFSIIKTNNFRGDISSISAETATLVFNVQGDDDEAMARDECISHSTRLDSLMRRPHTYAPFIKLAAMLGWVARPLPSRAAVEGGDSFDAATRQPTYHALSHCTLECPVCGSVVGLWSFEAAEGV